MLSQVPTMRKQVPYGATSTGVNPDFDDLDEALVAIAAERAKRKENVDKISLTFFMIDKGLEF